MRQLLQPGTQTERTEILKSGLAQFQVEKTACTSGNGLKKKKVTEHLLI